MGSWCRSVRGIAQSLAVAVCLTGSAQAQLTQLWHYQGQVNGSNWRSLAIGASGSQIVSNPDGGSGAVALFAGSDGPGSPLIWSDTSAAQARTGIVAAASRDDAYANLYFNPVTGSGQAFVPRLTLRRSGNSATVW